MLGRNGGLAASSTRTFVCWKCLIEQQDPVRRRAVPALIHIRQWRLRRSTRFQYERHTRRQYSEAVTASGIEERDSIFSFHYSGDSLQKPGPFREELREWYRNNEHLEPSFAVPALEKSDPEKFAIYRRDERGSGETITVRDKTGDTASFSDDIALQSGDLVELMTDHIGRLTTMAVFIRKIGPQIYQFFTVRGSWFHTRNAAAVFSVPGFFSPQELEPILPHLPSDKSMLDEARNTMFIHDWSVPRKISGTLISKMRGFEVDVEDLRRTWTGVLAKAHDTLAHDTDNKYMTLKEMASKLFPRHVEHTPALMFALERALLRQTGQFEVDGNSHRSSHTFLVRSRTIVDAYQHAVGHARIDCEDKVSLESSHDELLKVGGRGLSLIHTPNYTSRLQKFVAKIRRLIEISRESRSQLVTHACIGPYTPRDADQEGPNRERILRKLEGISFTETERTILDFLEFNAVRDQFAADPAATSALAHIMRLTRCYDNESPDGEARDFNSGSVYKLLQESGILTPFENRNKYVPSLGLPGYLPYRDSRQLVELNKELRHTTSWDLQDSMGDMRVDWKDMHVYCIDSADAEELDDGVSLERIQGEDDQFWVHVHIANPTSHLDPSTNVSRMARHRLGTVYLPEGSCPMLPKDLCQRYFSLQKDRPVLTFSTKLDSDGNVLDRKVQVGTVHNVISITPEQVNVALGQAQSSPKFSLSVGGSFPKKADQTVEVTLSESQIAELEILSRLSEARSKIRRDGGALVFGQQGTVSIRVAEDSSTPGLTHRPPSHTKPRFILGDPIISLEAAPSQPLYSPISAAQRLVVEFMTLACETSALWTRSRGIPSIYRRTVFQGNQADPARYFKEMVLPNLTDNGIADQELLNKYRDLVGGSLYSTEPGPHYLVAADAYSRTTSPLRRYLDMAVHWQIESELRREAEGYNQADWKYPFSSEDLTDLAAEAEWRERARNKAIQFSNDFWISMLFYRAFYHKEATLPEKFTVVVKDVSSTDGDALVIPLDFPVTFVLTVDEGVELAVGDLWEAAITFVDTYDRSPRGRLRMKGIQKVGHTDTMYL